MMNASIFSPSLVECIPCTHRKMVRTTHLMPARRVHSVHRQRGITLTELLITVAIAATIMAGLAGVVGQALQSEDAVRGRNNLTQQTRFAMQRMVSALTGTRRLILPLGDNPNTDWHENVREQTVPASSPEGSSIKATAVLAVTLDPTIDQDGDGFMDADNDKDTLIDEDIGSDNNEDGMPGLANIDDDGDGLVDESNKEDDDEDEDTAGSKDEDPLNGIDDDNDGSIDEDIGSDMNADGWPGIVSVDEDGDGQTDESNKEDDDEDEDDRGTKDEDWLDTVAFYLNGSDLIERRPTLTDINTDGLVNGADYIESVITSNVTLFRVQRIPQGSGRAVLVDITLVLTNASNESISLNTRVRIVGDL